MELLFFPGVSNAGARTGLSVSISLDPSQRGGYRPSKKVPAVTLTEKPREILNQSVSPRQLTPPSRALTAY